MALMGEDYCTTCESTTMFVNRKCSKCSEREHREEVAKWNALTTEEKLQDLRRRVEKLEQGPPRF